MKKLFISIMLFVFCAGAASAEPVLLRYRFSEGDHLEYVLNVTGEGEVEMVMPGADGNIAQKMPLDMAMNMNMTTDVTAVEGDVGTMDMRITRYRITQGDKTLMDYTAGEDPGDGPSAGLAEIFAEPMIIKMDEKGNVKEFSGLEKLSKLSHQFDLGDLLSRMQQQLPEDPVDIGATWSSSINIGEGEQSQEIVSNFELVGFETVKDLDCAKIKTSLSGDMADFIEGMLRQFPMAGNTDVEYMIMDLTGYMFFEPVSGTIIATEFQMQQDMAMTMDIKAGKESHVMKMKMKMTMDGVYELE